MPKHRNSLPYHFPPQLTSLSALVELELNCVSLAEDSLAPLASLPSLRNLHLHDHALPASLARLTQLKVLSVARMFSDWAAPLWAVLPALQQLTTLSLKFGWLDRSQPLVPSLASLPRLERVCFTVEGFHDMFTLPLPAGPWVSYLRVLAAPFCILRPSIELLRGAGKLEHPTSLGPPMPDGMPDGPCPGWRAFFDFLASHPPLRCFCVESDPGEFIRREFVTAMCRLHCSRPGLLWRHADCGYTAKHFLQDSLPTFAGGDWL